MRLFAKATNRSDQSTPGTLYSAIHHPRGGAWVSEFGPCGPVTSLPLISPPPPLPGSTKGYMQSHFSHLHLLIWWNLGVSIWENGEKIEETSRDPTWRSGAPIL